MVEIEKICDFFITQVYDEILIRQSNYLVRHDGLTNQFMNENWIVIPEDEIRLETHLKIMYNLIIGFSRTHNKKFMSQIMKMMLATKANFQNPKDGLYYSVINSQLIPTDTRLSAVALSYSIVNNVIMYQLTDKPEFLRTANHDLNTILTKMYDPSSALVISYLDVERDNITTAKQIQKATQEAAQAAAQVKNVGLSMFSSKKAGQGFLAQTEEQIYQEDYTKVGTEATIKVLDALIAYHNHIGGKTVLEYLHSIGKALETMIEQFKLVPRYPGNLKKGFNIGEQFEIIYSLLYLGNIIGEKYTDLARTLFYNTINLKTYRKQGFVVDFVDEHLGALEEDYIFATAQMNALKAFITMHTVESMVVENPESGERKIIEARRRLDLIENAMGELFNKVQRQFINRGGWITSLYSDSAIYAGQKFSHNKTDTEIVKFTIEAIEIMNRRGVTYKLDHDQLRRR